MLKSVVLSLAAAASLLPGAGHAQGYFGVHVGASEVTEDSLSLEGMPFGDIEYDDGYVFGLLGGWQFSRFFAGELELTGQTNDSDFFIGDEDYSVTAFLVNAVVSTPDNQPIILWGGVGAGFASPNIDDGGNGFAWQAKGGVDIRIMGPHFVSLQAAMLETDGFRQTQDGTEFEVGYGNQTYSVGYRFRF